MTVDVESSNRPVDDSALTTGQLESGLYPEKHKSPHILALDGLRGLAILLVFFSHTTVMIAVSAFDREYVEGVDCGWMGVDLFFILSGFLITGIIFESKGSPHYFRNFYMRSVRFPCSRSAHLLCRSVYRCWRRC